MQRCVSCCKMPSTAPTTTTGAMISLTCGILALAAVGISYLVKLDYQSTHQGMLIDAWSAPGAKNSFHVMEKFQYGIRNHTCLIKRRKERSEKQAKKVTEKKKLGTTRKVWLYKDGHCTDSSLRQYLLQAGLGFLAPLCLAISCGCGLFCVSTVQEIIALFSPPPIHDQQRSGIHFKA